jgi:outer membrane protein assembly factor BamB
MWVTAIAVVLFVWLASSGPDDHEGRRVPGDAPVRRPDRDRAPADPRADLPLRATPEAGPPPTFRMDRRHTGRSPVEGPRSAELVWSFETRGPITAQAVVGDDGTVYVGSHDGFFYAITSYGQEVWKVRLDGLDGRGGEPRIYATAAIDADGNIFVGSDADTFFSISARGEVRWRLATEGDADTGATVGPDGTVYFAAGASLYAVAPGGVVKWRFEAREKIYSTPAVDDDGTVYVGSQDDHLYALDGEGRVRWSYETRGDNDSSPVIADDGTLLFGSDDGNVYALTRDGALRWAAPMDGYVRAPVGLALDGSVIVGVFGPRPRVVSLDAETGRESWFFSVTLADSAEIGISSGPIVDRLGHVYVGAHDDYLYSLSPSGQLRWIFETDGDIDASPVIAPDGTLYVGSDDGRLYALR